MAVTRGGATIKPTSLADLKRELAAGWPDGLTVLTGEDLYHLDKAQQALIDALVPAGASEFALSVYGDQRIDTAAVVASARSAGMFASRRVVLVRDVEALDGDPQALKDYAANPPRNSHLIVRAPSIDRRRKLGQVLAKSGRLLAFPAMASRNTASLLGQVEKLATDKQLELDRGVAALLADVCQADFYRIDAELEKIRAWLGEEPRRVTPLIVREIASGSAMLSGWEVAVAIGRRDRAGALVACRRLLAAGDEPLRMIGGVAFRVRGMLRARAMIENGTGPAQAVRASRLWGDAPAEVARGLSRYTLNELLGFPSLLLEADRTLKSRILAPAAVLESMLDRMMPPTVGSEASGR